MKYFIGLVVGLLFSVISPLLLPNPSTPVIGDGNYRVYSITPMYEVFTGKPVYYVLADREDKKGVLSGHVKLYMIERDKFEGLGDYPVSSPVEKFLNVNLGKAYFFKN